MQGYPWRGAPCLLWNFTVQDCVNLLAGLVVFRPSCRWPQVSSASDEGLPEIDQCGLAVAQIQGNIVCRRRQGVERGARVAARVSALS